MQPFVVVALLLAQWALGDGVCTGRRKSVDATVTLGQRKHSSYDATHTTNIHELLENLNEYYPAIHETDLLLWHEVGSSFFSFAKPEVHGRPNIYDAPPRTNLRNMTLRR